MYEPMMCYRVSGFAVFFILFVLCMKAIVLAAWYGTRMLPITKSIPKEMLPVGNKPVIHYVVQWLAMAGITEIIMIVSGSKEPLEMYFDKNYELESLLQSKNKTYELTLINQTKAMAKIVFLKQLEQKGTGHAILQARERVSDDFAMVVYGDSVYHPDFFRQAIATHQQTGKAVMTLKEVWWEDVHKYGVAKIEHGHITGIVEKPSRDDAPSNLVNFSPFIIPHAMFDRLEKTQPDPRSGEIYPWEAFQYFMDKSEVVPCVVDAPLWDTGNVDARRQANIEWEKIEECFG